MIGITTYCKTQGRFELIKKSFESLIKTINKDIIIVSDDCSPMDDHIKRIEEKGIKVIRRNTNGGYAKSKNTLIKYILDNGYNTGFLADDDNVYEDGRYTDYIYAMKKTGISHFSLRLSYLTIDHSQRPYGDTKEINGFKIRQTPLVNGCFLTFTREMIEKMGYMNEMPHKNGHEHSIFTQRAIHNGFAPYYCDLLEPKVNNLQILDKSYELSEPEAYDPKKLEENGKLFQLDYSKFYPFHD